MPPADHAEPGPAVPAARLAVALAMPLAVVALRLQAAPVSLDEKPQASASRSVGIDSIDAALPQTATSGALSTGKVKAATYDVFARKDASQRDQDEADEPAGDSPVGTRPAATAGLTKPSAAAGAAASAASSATRPSDAIKATAKGAVTRLNEAFGRNRPELPDEASADRVGADRSSALPPDLVDATSVRTGDAARGDDRGSAYVDNPLRQVMQTGRSLLGHPLTWLVVVLVAAGRIVFSVAGRRKR